MKISMTSAAMTTAASLLVCGATSHAQSRPQAERADSRDAVVSAMGLADGELVSVDISEIVIGDSFQITVPAGPRDEPIRVRFSPNDVRAPGYQLIEDRGPEGLFSMEPGAPRTVAGSSADLPGATIRGSMLDDGLHAVFRWPDGRIQWIEPAGRFVDGLHADLHVFYDNDSIPPSGGVCGTHTGVTSRQL